MDLKLLTLSSALAFVLVQTTEATLFPVSFNCCTEVSHHVPRRLLRQVLKFEIQKDDGVCNLPAVILHVKHKKLCVSSHNKTIKKWMERNRIKNRRRDGNHHSGKKRNTKRKKSNCGEALVC
ncbi:C-C motif chemokine 28 [Carettochelys insculpta]|uniref:C-C motif chemokine 28 n=1 Tax=Carettochelys insculpta TaxID=44489 RepID=UPI003EBFEBBD